MHTKRNRETAFNCGFIPLDEKNEGLLQYDWEAACEICGHVLRLNQEAAMKAHAEKKHGRMPEAKEARLAIIRSQGGSLERVVDVETQDIQDLWHIAQACKKKFTEGEEVAEMILDVWHLAHELKRALILVADGADISKPIPTK